MQTHTDLSPDEVRRYSRHLVLPEIGVAGQKRLRNARVLIVGAGGLGSPVALYLAAAGVGTLGLVDIDNVEVSNLQRQILHGTSGVGHAKLASATLRLNDLNPHVEVVAHDQPLARDNAYDVIAGYDIVVDGTDNFQTRYLVSDACVLLQKINVFGSIYRFEGQVSVFDQARGPCYRCLYPAPPPAGLVPNCAEGGVLGVLPGVIGTIQATETVKLITGAGQPLIGRLLLYDALDMTFSQIDVRKDPHCPICGEAPTIRGLIDYDEFCGVMPATPAGPGLPEISVQDLKQRIDAGLDRAVLLDVREPHEWQIAQITEARFMPQGTVPNHLDTLAQASELFVLCRSGRRSADVVRLLLDAGFTRVKNVRGGILAWSREIDPNMPAY